MLRDVVAELIPQVHAQLISGQDLSAEPRPADEDFSRTDQCERLTLALYKLLDAQGFPVRREFHGHPYSNQWHFIIAHSLEEPSDNDIITDLNPWTFATTTETLPDFIHTDRRSAINLVLDSGSHRVRAECLEITTIADPNFTEPATVESQNLMSRLHTAIFDKALAGFDFGFSDWRDD